MDRCEARISPLANRLVIFSTTDFTYHGHADPLLCPSHRSRRSIAMYYYTKTRPEHEISRDAKGGFASHSTLYQLRKCASCQQQQCFKPPEVALPTTPSPPPPPQPTMMARLFG